MNDATEKDFERLFQVAKAHGFSLSDCYRIAMAEVGKKLQDFTQEELREFAFRLCHCEDVSEVGHIHSEGDA